MTNQPPGDIAAALMTGPNTEVANISPRPPSGAATPSGSQQFLAPVAEEEHNLQELLITIEPTLAVSDAQVQLSPPVALKEGGPPLAWLKVKLNSTAGNHWYTLQAEDLEQFTQTGKSETALLEAALYFYIVAYPLGHPQPETRRWMPALTWTPGQSYPIYQPPKRGTRYCYVTQEDHVSLIRWDSSDLIAYLDHPRWENALTAQGLVKSMNLTGIPRVQVLPAEPFLSEVGHGFLFALCEHLCWDQPLTQHAWGTREKRQ